MRKKIQSQQGLAVLTAILLVAVIGMLAWLGTEAYMRHLQDVRRTFDSEQVNIAERNARIEYIADGMPMGITYYYDAENTMFRSFDEINLIKGYGRSYESENLHSETGAPGIPNLGGENGAQILAVTFDDPEHMSIRWQGFFLTPYDMELMTTAEQSRLTTEQLNQIEISRQRQEQLEQQEGVEE